MNSAVLQLLQNNFLLIFIFLNFILLGERPFKCHICQKAFKQSSDLKKHINLHTGANQFKCEECNMEFRRADALRKHKLGHKVGNMPCGHCGKNFLHIGALRAHRAMHNGKTDKKISLTIFIPCFITLFLACQCVFLGSLTVQQLSVCVSILLDPSVRKFHQQK